MSAIFSRNSGVPKSTYSKNRCETAANADFGHSLNQSMVQQLTSAGNWRHLRHKHAKRLLGQSSAWWLNACCNSTVDVKGTSQPAAARTHMPKQLPAPTAAFWMPESHCWCVSTGQNSCPPRPEGLPHRAERQHQVQAVAHAADQPVPLALTGGGPAGCLSPGRDVCQCLVNLLWG